MHLAGLMSRPMKIHEKILKKVSSLKHNRYGKYC